MRSLIASLAILLPVALYSQNEARKTPLAAAEATSLGNSQAASGMQEPMNKDIVSLNASGDPNITIPFLTIESRSMQIPVDLQYSPGIKVDARSGPVGLGWSVNFGSIVRDYGAYEPDYSTITHETEMRSANGQTNLAAFAQQGLNNKTLAYDGLPADQFTPDKYHVSLPGRSGGTFWNKNGPPATEHAFVFSGGEPWKVETEIGHFVHPQEISRINEYNYIGSSAGNVLNKRGSFANAIGFAPYVTGTNSELAVSSPFGATHEWDGLSPVSYDDLKKFVVVTEDGTRYVFDRPLVGQKYLFGEDPFWSLVNRPNDEDYVQNHSIKGEWWKTEYIAEWLLTAILSYDYVDANANGKADDGDAGDWIRIEYTEPEQLEQRLVYSNLSTVRPVPKHREWSNFTQTDQASSLMRELAYVTRIVTPLREYRFEISQRMEVDHDFFSKPANCIGNNEYIYEDLHFTNDPEEGDATFDLRYPVETMKYDQVTTYDRTKDIALYPLEGRALRTTKLRYAEKGSAEELAVSKYLIRTNENVEFNLAGPEHHFSPSSLDDHLVPDPALPNSFSIEAFNVEVINAETSSDLKGRGKTTLLGVDHLSGNGTDPTNKQSYSFEYGYNPSYSEIHKREIVRKRFFPVKRQSGRNQAPVVYPPINDYILSGSKHHASEFLFDGPSLAINYALESNAAVDLIADETVAFDFLSPGNNGAFDAFSATFSESNPHLLREVVNKNISTWAPMSYTGAHTLSPIEDEFGYYSADDPDIDRSAWSLSSLRTPNGGRIDLIYEADTYQGNDETSWSFRSDAIPVISDYNELAKRLSCVQNAVNTVTTSEGSIPAKMTPSVFSMPLDQFAGGLRLKRKTVDPGHGPVMVHDYTYGPGHYTDIPEDYVANYIGEFSRMMQWETIRQAQEDNSYEVNIVVNWPSFTNGFNEHMRYHGYSIRLDNWHSDHYYEWVRETMTENGSTITTYGDGLPQYTETDGTIKPICMKLGPSSKDKVFILQGSSRYLHGPRLLRTEERNTSNQLINCTEQKYDWSGFLDTRPIHSAQFLEAPYTVSHQLYAKLVDNTSNEFNLWAFHDWEHYLLNHIDNFRHWTTLGGGIDPPAYFMLSHTMDYPLLSLPALPPDHFLLASFRIQPSSIVTTRSGLVQKRDLNYDLNTGALRWERSENSTTLITGQLTTEAVMTNMVFAFEDYPALLAKNLLSPISRTTSYANAIAAENVLSSRMQTWDVSGVVPRPAVAYSYSGGLNAEGCIPGFQPFNIDVPPPSAWQPRGTILEHNVYGRAVLVRNNDLYTRTDPGYNGAWPSANIQWDGGWFDAAYTGFEDLPPPTANAQQPEHPDFDHWHEINAGSNEAHERNMGFAEFTASLIAPEGWVNDMHSVDIAAQNRFFLRFNNEDGAYAVGDRVRIRVRRNPDASANAVFNCHPSTPEVEWYEDEFERTIDGLAPSPQVESMDGDPASLGTMVHFSEPFPEWMYYYFNVADCYPGEQTPTITKLSISGTSKPVTRRRSGQYAYWLAKRPSAQSVAERTPRRYIRLKGSSVGNACSVIDPLEEVDRSVVQPECYEPYTVSFYARFGGLTEFGDDLQAFRDPPLIGQLQAAMGGHDVKLIWKVWNSSRTNVLQQGSLYLEGMQDGNWHFFQADLPILRGGADRLLDVYIQNNIIGGNSTSTPQLYIDDLLIRPRGARCTYRSLDQFGNTTHNTDQNHVTTSTRYDEWGRLYKSFDASENLLETHEYFTTDNIGLRHNYTQVARNIDATHAHVERTYTDGLGRTLQTVTTEPLKNIRTFTNTTTYDANGRVATTLLPYARMGVQLTAKSDAAALSTAQDQYNSQYPYTRTNYFAEPSARISSTDAPRETTEANVSTLQDRHTNTSALVVGDKTYPIGELMVDVITDPEGRPTETYTDKFGHTIAIHTHIGFPHVREADGPVTELTEGDYEEAWTFFAYDPSGNLTKIIDPEGKVITHIYSSLGQVVATTDPDKGSTWYRYDKFGRLRFSRSSTDIAATGDQLADQFRYIRYDVLDRVVEEGMMKIPGGGTPAFNDVALRNDPTYPSTAYGREIHHRKTYDGETSSFAMGRLVSEVTNTFNNPITVIDLQGAYVPDAMDQKDHTYDPNGRLISTAYQFDGLAGTRKLNWQYNRTGLPTSQVYSDPAEPAFSFTIRYTYDDLGRKLTSSSGQSTQSEDVRYRYDVLGNLFSKRLGPIDPDNGVWQDKVTMNYTLRGDLAKQHAKHHRFELTTSSSGNITEKVWNTPHLDNGSTQFNTYAHYYDRMDRLTGADYSTISAPTDPWAGYMNSLHQDPPTVICEQREPWVEIREAINTVKALIAAADANKMTISDGLADQLIDLVSLLQEQLITAGKNWSELNPQEQEKLLLAIYQLAAEKSIDLRAAEDLNRELEAILKGQGTVEKKLEGVEKTLDEQKNEEEQVLEKTEELKEENKSVLEEEGDKTEKKETLEETKETADQDFTFTRLLLGTLELAFAQHCVINESALALHSLQTNDQQWVRAPEDKYDEAFWYKTNGDFTEKWRFDHLANHHTIDYTYAPGKSHLTDVHFSTLGNTIPYSYTYDARGNATSDGHLHLNELRYAAFHDLPVLMEAGSGYDASTWHYRYDQQGQRSVQSGSGNNGTDFYLGHVILDETGRPKRYTLDEGFATLDASNVVHKYYSVKDHLGTPRVTFDQAGVVDARDLHAYGQPMPLRQYISLQEGTRFQFTGHEHDPVTQLDYHGARYYDAEVGRYLSLDPLAADYAGWSPYNYVMGNPISLTDPTGRSATKYEDEAGNVIGETDDGINDIVTIGNEDLDYFKGMLRREQSLKNDAVNNPARNKQWAEMFGVATRPNPSPGMSIPTPDAQSVQFSLTGAVGAGVSLDIGVAWTKEGDVSPFFAIGPAFGADVSGGISHSQYWSYTGRDLSLNDLTGVGAEHSAGILFIDAASGGDLSNNVGPLGGDLRNPAANKYYSESVGISGGLPLGYSYKLKNTSLLR